MNEKWNKQKILQVQDLIVERIPVATGTTFPNTFGTL